MKNKYLIFLSLLIISIHYIPFSYSQTYISEINFIDEEYLEIYSNDSLNFSNFNVYDENGFYKFNSLELFQKKNTSLYLFVGSSFLDKHDVSSFNCSIYKTSGSQLSNGGLKQNGENISISNNTSNFFWKKENNLFFDFNTSLHIFNSTQNIQNQSPCSLSNLWVNKVNQSNQTNQSNNNISSMGSNLCENIFSISTLPREITNKVEFNFNIKNNTNISIEYWVENYEGEILKNKLLTKNTNTKSFTPTKTTPIIIKAKLFQNNCSYENTSQTFFYKFEEKISSSKEEIVEDLEPKSSISFSSRQEINGFLELGFEIYRGDSSKRTMYIYNNNKQQHSIEIPNKFTKIKGKLRIKLDNGENMIKFLGIDLEQTLNHFYENPTENIQKELNFKIPKIKFFNISSMQNIISRPIFTNSQIELICTIYQKNTKVSKEYTSILEPGFYIIPNTLNISKIKFKSNTSNIELKYLCKYKSLGLKSFKYDSEYFSINLGEIKSKNISKIINKNTFSSFSNNKTTLSQKKPKNISIFNSDQTKLREKANIPILFAMSLLIIIFILVW